MKTEKRRKKKYIYDEVEVEVEVGVDFLRGSRLVVHLCFIVKAF